MPEIIDLQLYSDQVSCEYEFPAGSKLLCVQNSMWWFGGSAVTELCQGSIVILVQNSSAG